MAAATPEAALRPAVLSTLRALLSGRHDWGVEA